MTSPPGRQGRHRLRIPSYALPALTALAIALLAMGVSAVDNDTPETAAPLDQHNYVSEYLNASDDTLQYWYWMDVARGDELFVYFYGTGDQYHRCRMLYYVHGPDSYDATDVVHSEYWYRQKADRNDYSDYWHWICPRGGRYYFHFYAIQGAVGSFHANISRDSPVTIHRFAVDTGTLWWGGVTDQNNNDVWKIWLDGSKAQVEGVEVTVNWTYTHRINLYAYDLVDDYAQNLLNMSYSFQGDTREVMRFTASYTGWYYIRLEYYSWSGVETYTIKTREYTAPNDGNNDIHNATFVPKTSTIDGRLEASRDMHDWYTVDLVKGDLVGISMQIRDPHNPAYNPGAANFYNFFEIQVYDPFMRRVSHGYDSNGGWPVPDTYINNLPMQPSDVTVTGRYLIRASFSTSYGYYYDATNTTGHIIAFCGYELQITIPNRKPRINTTALEDVIMLEDTTWWETLAGANVSSLDLATVFIDPEGGVLTFSVRSDPNVTATLRDDAVRLKPRADWFGEADIWLGVTDDSGNSEQAWLHVTVVPVNDRPRVVGTAFPPFEFDEDEPEAANRTLGLYDRFYDVDEEDAHALTFSATPHAAVAADIDQATGNITFQVDEDVNGAFSLTVWATDTHGAKVSTAIAISVVAVNDPPKPTDAEPVYRFDEGFLLEAFDVAEHFVDPDGDDGFQWLVAYADPADKANLSITNEGKDTSNSVLVVIPAEGKHDWFGRVRLVVTCVDPGRLASVKELLVVVDNTPDPPEIAAWDPRTDASVAEGGTLDLTVTSVNDPDGEDQTLTFIFWLKGPSDPVLRQVQNTSSPTYQLVTDFESAGRYQVKVIVRDSTGLESVNPVEWLVTVTKTNRVPTLNIASPEEGKSFTKGKWVEFQADIDDPDVEDRGTLKVEWYEGDALLGKGATLSLRNLKAGSHEVTCVVTDAGGASVEATVNFKVKEAEDGPGPGALAAMAALSLASLAALARKGPRRAPP